MAGFLPWKMRFVSTPKFEFPNELVYLVFSFNSNVIVRLITLVQLEVEY